MYQISYIIVWCIIICTTTSQYPSITEECPDPSWRSPYDPELAFNRYLGTNDYPLHPRNDAIIGRILQNINEHKVSWSRKVPIFVVAADSDWETFDVEYNGASSWAQFKVPPADLIDGEMGSSPYDGSEDFPFLIFDPNSTLHGEYTELRGFHTYVDHTAKIFYCEGCGLFKYNNDGEIIAPDSSQSMGQDYIGQGTGCGLSWPGVVRREDVLSGVIAHAIRAAWSSCQFFDTGQTEWVSPAIKTDQPKGVSQSNIDTVNDDERVGMGYRFRLAPTTTCHDRLAPLYENNGIWYPPTQMMTDFTRMFCTAMRDYGFILSDGSGGCQSSIFQGESDVTANWTEVFDADIDESTESWSFLVRDYTTPDDNRYRDERYGVPWHNLQVLNDSDVGDINDCCKNGICSPSPAVTSPPFVDIESGPTCLNENCCFKHRNIGYKMRIADDDCVIYNCTFTDVDGSDIIKVRPKRDGTWSNNTLIAMNIFNINPLVDQDAVHIDGGINVKIYDNWFSDTIQPAYNPISLTLGMNIDIENNTFTGPTGEIGINLDGNLSISDIENVNIIGNTFDSMQYGIQIYKATNTNIKNNIFTNIDTDGSAIRWRFVSSDENVANGVNIEGNTISNAGRGIYVGYDIGVVTIRNNIINNIIDSSKGKAIELSGISTGVIIDGNIITNTAHNGIYIEEGNNDIQIINNNIGYTGDHGINCKGDNYLISGNIVHHVDASSGLRALYLASYGTVARNTIYAVSRRGISITGTTALAGGELVIENNMIYGIDQEPIDFYDTKNANSPTKIIIRFNTVVTDTGYTAIDLEANEYDLYCNLVVASTSNDFWPTGSSYIVNEFGNLQYLFTDINTVVFVNDDMTVLDSVDLHLQITSPVIQQCDALETATYPLPSVDFDGTTRELSYIDVGADQVSPVVPTAPTTPVPTSSPTSPPTVGPTATTDSPTAAPSTDIPTSSPTIPGTLPTTASPSIAVTEGPTAMTPTKAPILPSATPGPTPLRTSEIETTDENEEIETQEDIHSHGGVYAVLSIFIVFCVVFTILFGIYFLKYKKLKESVDQTKVVSGHIVSKVCDVVSRRVEGEVKY